MTWIYYMKHIIQDVGTNVYRNNPSHMTNMAARTIYDKNPSKIFFSETGGSISTKLGMLHLCLKYYYVCICIMTLR